MIYVVLLHAYDCPRALMNVFPLLMSSKFVSQNWVSVGLCLPHNAPETDILKEVKTSLFFLNVSSLKVLGNKSASSNPYSLFGWEGGFRVVAFAIHSSL